MPKAKCRGYVLEKRAHRAWPCFGCFVCLAPYEGRGTFSGDHDGPRKGRRCCLKELLCGGMRRTNTSTQPKPLIPRSLRRFLIPPWWAFSGRASTARATKRDKPSWAGGCRRMSLAGSPMPPQDGPTFRQQCRIARATTKLISDGGKQPRRGRRGIQ